MEPIKSAFARLVATDGPSTANYTPPPKPAPSPNPARFLIIGAGSRGQIYAAAIQNATNGKVAAIIDPIEYKRNFVGKAHIWGPEGQPGEGQSFSDWNDFLHYELDRRRRAEAGEAGVPEGVDGVFVCVRDELHKPVLQALAPLGLHIMCEKPLACSLEDCLDVYAALKPFTNSKIFSIGHVLRYSPHNIMLRKLLVEDKIIGDIYSAVHTEPVGWWHFTHSYVRGNWRNSKTTGPSLLTKSCHDIDLMAWILSSPEKPGVGSPHLPSTITSTGGLQHFKKSRKPKAAGSATNCTKCPLGDSGCKYSAKNIYLGDRYSGIRTGNVDWPVHIVVPDIEDYKTVDERAEVLRKAIEEDYPESAPESEVSARNWFGRCVFESDNDVCDEQFVTIEWPETPDHPSKRAAFHMVVHTIKQCDRYTYFYGEHGEIYADSTKIVIQDLETKEVKTLWPKIEDLGHGGGDTGLTRQFVTAVDKVKNGELKAEAAQLEYLRCTLDEVIMSHALVFAAEEARLGKTVVDWADWWNKACTEKMGGQNGKA